MLKLQIKKQLSQTELNIIKEDNSQERIQNIKNGG